MDRKVVLVVEDNQDELMIYTTLLSYAGYAILTASDFEAAVTIAREQLPDMAVVDVNLGEGERDGCDVVRAFRDDPRTRDIPVIAHTAYSDVYHDALARVGCARVVHKPASPTVLLEAIREILGEPGESAEAKASG